MSEQAPESVDLQSLTFDQLNEAAALAKKTLQARPNPDGTVDYYAADNLTLPIAKTYSGPDERYYIYLELFLFGRVLAEVFDTAEAANDTLKAILIENEYRIM